MDLADALLIALAAGGPSALLILTAYAAGLFSDLFASIFGSP